jgi:hypothetical protein
MTTAQQREIKRVIGRLTNTQGWFHREFGDLSSAVEYDQESIELGRTHHWQRTGSGNALWQSLIYH